MIRDARRRGLGITHAAQPLDTMLLIGCDLAGRRYLRVEQEVRDRGENRIRAFAAEVEFADDAAFVAAIADPDDAAPTRQLGTGCFRPDSRCQACCGGRGKRQ